MSEALSFDAKWRKICTETLNLVSKFPDAWIFQSPVVESAELGHDAKLAYMSVISVPMDLRTIKRNIPALESPMEFEADMLTIFANCRTFNQPHQDAYEMGKDVEIFFLSKWELELRKQRAIELYNESLLLDVDRSLSSFRKVKQSSPAYDPVLRKVVDLPPETATRVARRPVLPTPTSSNEIEPILREILGQIRSNTNFSWFELPVWKYPLIPLEVQKSYYQLIRVPMDLSTVEKNLGQYPNFSEMKKDLELIVTNSVRFNPPESVVNLAARELQASIDKLFASRIDPLGKSWSRIPPESPPPDILPTPAPTKTLRLKRSATVDVGPSQTDHSVKRSQTMDHPESAAPAKVKKPGESSLQAIDRPMNAVTIPAFCSDWRIYAYHVLNELNQLRDEDARGLCWLLQKPAFKYDLPTQVKRMYYLTVTETMDMQTIQAKLDKRIYGSVGEFERDMYLMLDNCLVFNDEAQYPHKVGLVVYKHFEKYWGQLRNDALAAPPAPHAPAAISIETPNWNEMRTAAMHENVKPGIDTGNVSSSAPLNGELLYEWRVAQRYAQHEARRILNV